MSLKFNMASTPFDPAEQFKDNPQLAASTLAGEYTNTLPVADEEYGEAVQAAKRVLDWTLQRGETPENRAALREYANTILAANQEEPKREEKGESA